MPERIDLKIFIASSGELNIEREESLKVIVELNKGFKHLHLEPILFELDTSSGNNPGMTRIQDAINVILDESDIVVVLFYSKIGEFTKEEFDRAKNNNKKIFLYLKEGFQPIRTDESIKYTGLLKLKEDIETDSELRYQKFKNPVDYNGILYKDLNKYIGDNYSLQNETFKIAFSQNNFCINELSDFPKPSFLFTGRKDKINEFKNVFNSFQSFAIEGLGGTGKTQFVAKCIEEIISNKNNIIWLNGSNQSNFEVFIESAGYGDVLKGEKKSELDLYNGFKDLIEKDQRIIFWDNYNDLEDVAFSNFLSFAHPYLQKSSIILITKTDPLIKGITALPIVKLEGLDLYGIEYAKKLKVAYDRYSSILDLDLEKICKGVEGHPLAIEFSMQLMGYGKSVEDIMFHMPEIGIKRVEEFSKRLFLDIFYHSGTTDEERECFLKCSVFRERINEKEIKFLNDGKDIFHLLVGLMDKLLISFKDGYYEMHPLVRSFSYEKLIDKKGVHKKAANYFINQRLDTLNASLEEKIFYHLSEAQEWEIIADSLEFIGRKFIQLGQLGLINEFMNKLKNANIFRPVFEILYGDIEQIKGEWDKAIKHFEFASNNKEGDVIIKAEGIIKYGEILFRKGNLKEALSSFENAYLFSNTNRLLKEEARALNDIGLIYFDFDKIDIAYQKHTAALKIRKEIFDLEGIATSYNNIANIFEKKGQYNKAIEYYNESYKIKENMGDKIGAALPISSIAFVLKKQKKLNEAFLKINLSLNIYKEIGDKAGIISSSIIIGSIYIDQGKLEEGFQKYKESLVISEEIGDKKGIATSLNNIGTFYLEIKKENELALYYFFKSLCLQRQIGNKIEEKNVIGWITLISNNLEKNKFKELAIQVFDKLDNESKKYLSIKEFFNDPIKNESPKIGRNDGCPCGSTKKYKNCHGRN